MCGPVRRGPGGPAKAIGNAIQFMTETMIKDHVDRDAFAGKAADDLLRQFPGWTVVVFATGGELGGCDAGSVVRQHTEMKYASGATQGYEVYLIQNGKRVFFHRKGDGGHLNWAVHGQFERGSGNQESNVWFPNKARGDRPC